MQKPLTITVLVLLAAVIAAGAALCDGTEPAPDAPDAGHADGDRRPDAGSPDGAPWIVAEPRQGEFVALVDGEPVDALFTIGAAGVYPALETRGSGIALPAPSLTMAGDVVPSVEIWARTPDGAHAFFGEVATDANAIDLVPASPLRVRVLDELGTPQRGVEVRAARDSVGLVILRAQTDADGYAELGAVPAGEYVATAEVAGTLTAEGEAVAGEVLTLLARKARVVEGVVRTADGVPVPKATVAVFSSSAGANPVDEIPIDVAATDAQGRYRAQGRDGTQFVAVAVADGAAPARVMVEAPPIGAVRLDVTLGAGHRVVAKVVDEAGRPVADARVVWHDDETRWGAARLSGRDGIARFGGVPRTARMRAVLDRFESGEVALGALPNAAELAVDLRLTSDDSRVWRVRVDVGARVAMRDIEARDASGIRCSITTSDGRDFTLRACGDGELTLRAFTDHGIAEWTAGPFVDGMAVRVPEPTPVEVDVTGAANEPWDQTLYELTGEGPTIAPVEVERRSDGATLRARVYPGRWTFRATNPRIGAVPVVFDVGAEPLRTAVELVALHEFRVEVVDTYGAPVTGAYAMLFSRSGALVDVARTAGQLPVELRVRPPFEGTLLVVDPRRGEGRVALDSTRDPTALARVRLSERVLALDTPAGRLARASLAERIGAKLVERDQGFVLDFERASPGTRAGLRRGDEVVSAWPGEGGTMRVIVRRPSEGYLDVVVSR